MTDAIAISELSMINDMRRLDVLSHNLANATTTAYKREIAVNEVTEKNFSTELESARHLQGSNMVPDILSVSDHAYGTLKHTGNALDVAIEGEGFFEFMGPKGLEYGRQGAFSLSASGRLQTQDGFLVNGLGGEIRLLNVSPRIDETGRLWDGDEPLGQLKLVSFSNAEQLSKVGNGRFTFNGSSGEITSIEHASLRQGYLETSNVVAMDEMVKMIETVRRFETSQQVISAYDGMMSTAIQTIAEF